MTEKFTTDDSMRILVVEDEPEMLGVLCEGFREHGHAAAPAGSAEQGLSLALATQFDVIILDVMLPGIDGYEMAAALRNQAHTPNGQTPIVMLTACDQEEQIIRGLDVGADYYVTKPFSFLELLARIKAAQRHIRLQKPTCVRVDDLLLDTERREARHEGKLLDLSKTEWKLLACLVSSRGATLTRGELMAAVWGADRKIGNSTLDAFINLLRNKVDLPFNTHLIQTERGIGYYIRPARAASPVSR